jgi:hypothetical protein
VASDPSKDCDQRRLIDVPEIKMIGARDVVERVAEIAVARRRRDVQRKVDSHNDEHPAPKGSTAPGILMQ